MNLTLKEAAASFSFPLPKWLGDDVVIGRICGTDILAGEIRRLNQALSPGISDLDQRLLEILKRPDSWQEPVGGVVQAIKYYRAETRAYLIDAKKYVEALRERNGL